MLIIFVFFNSYIANYLYNLQSSAQPERQRKIRHRDEDEEEEEGSSSELSIWNLVHEEGGCGDGTSSAIVFNFYLKFNHKIRTLLNICVVVFNVILEG